MCILLFQNFQDCDVVEDCSFDSYRTEVLIMQNPVHWFALQTWKELRSFLSLKFEFFSLFGPKVYLFLVFEDSVIGFTIELFMKWLSVT